MNLGQGFNGLRKTQPIVVHQKADGSPSRTATEAVIELLGTAHREARGFFIVERTARGVVTPRTLERDARFDQLDEIGSRQKILYEGIGNSARHVPQAGTSHGGPDTGPGVTHPFGYRTNLPQRGLHAQLLLDSCADDCHVGTALHGTTKDSHHLAHPTRTRSTRLLNGRCNERFNLIVAEGCR